jgi:hypothetical protein
VTVVRHVNPVRALRRALRRRSRRAVAEVIDASFHVDTEAICPDCLQWIGPTDFVRRNAFDLLEHEVCPPAVVRQNRT